MMVFCEATGSWNEPGYQYVYVGGNTFEFIVCFMTEVDIIFNIRRIWTFSASKNIDLKNNKTKLLRKKHKLLTQFCVFSSNLTDHQEVSHDTCDCDYTVNSK